MSESMMIPMFAAGIAFISVLLAAYGLIGYLGGASDSAKLKERVSGTSVSGSAALTAPLADAFRNALEFFGQLGTKIGPTESEEIDKNRKALIQAGLRKPDAVKIFQGVKGALVVTLGGLFLLGRFLLFPDSALMIGVFGAIALASLGLFGPEIWLRRKIANRRLAVANELPDALDLLVVCVESGMGLDQALDRVCRELKTSGPVISSELKLLTLELRAGKARADALRALSDRVGLEDLNSLTSLLVQADIFGISVGRTLRVYSDAMRTKRSQRAEEKAAKMPVLLLLPLVGFILPALFVTIIGPAVLVFIETFANIKG